VADAAAAADGEWLADHMVSATGTWSRPFVPRYPGHFAGRQVHTAQYRQASDFTGQRVMIVGGGNSAASVRAAHRTGRPLGGRYRPQLRLHHLVHRFQTCAALATLFGVGQTVRNLAAAISQT